MPILRDRDIAFTRIGDAALIQQIELLVQQLVEGVAYLRWDLFKSSKFFRNIVLRQSNFCYY